MKPKQRKCITTNIVKDKIALHKFIDVLFGKVDSLSETEYTLRANKHKTSLEKQNKKALDFNDTKRKVWKIKVDTLTVILIPRSYKLVEVLIS